jgi:hypothetical protein
LENAEWNNGWLCSTERGFNLKYPLTVSEYHANLAILLPLHGGWHLTKEV